MASNDDRVLYLINKLRSITLIVQVVPFLFTSVYIFVLSVYHFLPENVLNVLDTIFYISPMTIAGLFVMSKTLKLCAWHRRACALPILPQISVFIDYHITELSRVEAILGIAVPILMAILLLIAAWNVFLKPKHNVRRKETPDRNSRLLQDEADE